MPTPAALSLDIAVTSARTSRFLRRLHPVETSATWRTLATIAAHEPIRLGVLASLEQISQPAATSRMNHLVDQGLVDRVRDPDDGRAVMFTLTPLGLEQLNRFREAPLAAIEPAVADLTSEEQAALQRGLDLIRRVLDESIAAAREGTTPTADAP